MNHLSWTTQEYRHTEKTAEWFFASGIIAIALIAASALLGNILFAIVIALAAFSFFFFANRAPRAVCASVTDTEILFGDARYPYDSLASFWVETRDGFPRLILKQKKKLSLLVSIPTEEIHSNIIRAALVERVREEELHEPLPQKIMEYLGF